MAIHVTSGMSSLVASSMTEAPVRSDEDSLENLLRHSSQLACLACAGLYTLFCYPCHNVHRAHRGCAKHVENELDMLAVILAETVSSLVPMLAL